MTYKITMTALLACCACGPSHPSNGSDTQAPIMEALLSIRRLGSPKATVDVWDNNRYSLTFYDACQGRQGDITSVDVARLEEAADDPDLFASATDDGCEGFSYELFRDLRYLCWTDPNQSPATRTLAGFLDERLKEISWDGQVRQCTGDPPAVDPGGKELNPSQTPPPAPGR
ncbi:MAG: hypothetical protein ABW321_10425 [Polyangiales bacterium]